MEDEIGRHIVRIQDFGGKDRRDYWEDVDV
jgi:hypothetical protein